MTILVVINNLGEIQKVWLRQEYLGGGDGGGVITRGWAEGDWSKMVLKAATSGY